jgi:hypothetical protein
VCTYIEKKTTAEVVAALDLHRHPDGGFYLETFRNPFVALPPRCKPTFVVGSFVCSRVGLVFSSITPF